MEMLSPPRFSRGGEMVFRRVVRPAKRENFFFAQVGLSVNALIERKRDRCGLSEETEITRKLLLKRQQELDEKRDNATTEAQRLMAIAEEANDESIRIGRALAALDPPQTISAAEILLGRNPNPLASRPPLLSGYNALSGPLFGSLSADDVSIKGLVTSAFKTNRGFGLYGATSQELRDYIKDAFDRDIPGTSLSPTLSRMRSDDHVLRGPNNEGRWFYVGSS
jgi:hypothetical protein